MATLSACFQQWRPRRANRRLFAVDTGYLVGSARPSAAALISM